MLVNWNDIPGLREAIKRENDLRDASFLDLTTSICGIEIRQMTPRDLLILDGIGNPLLQGAFPSVAELCDFLWKLSPQYRPNAPLRRFLFGRKCRKLLYIQAVSACWQYIKDTFQDSPASSGVNAMPYAGWCAYLVNNIASSYGWTDEAILNISLKKLFQYLKCIKRSKDPECPMHNPSDKAKGDFVRMLHARTQLLAMLKRRMN